MAEYSVVVRKEDDAIVVVKDGKDVVEIAYDALDSIVRNILDASLGVIPS